MSALSYRRDIDGLRSLAVVPVVLNHAGFAAFPGGFVGVDIFFVISGFLITGIISREIEEGRFSIVNFYERRIRRIIPALYAMLAVLLVLGAFFLLPDEYGHLAKTSIASLFFSSNFWFWRVASDYFGDGVALEPLLHTWSLAVEEQFYVFFPLLLMLLAKRPRRIWTIAIAGLSLASLALSIWATRAEPIANFYLVPTRIWELGIGALLAIGAVPAARSKLVTEAVGATGLALIAGSVFLITAETPFPGLAAVPPCAGAAAILWAGRERETQAGRVLALPPLVWIGLISYSLYLWHWPILVAARIYTGSELLSWQVAVPCVVLATLVAWLSWRFVEQPFRRPNKGLRLSQRQIFGTAAVASVGVIAVCGALIATHGLPQRINRETWAAYLHARERSRIERVCMDGKAKDGPCAIGVAAKDGRVDYVVWGDSHAGAMLPGFDAWLKQTGKSGAAFAKSGCPPLLGVGRVDQGIGHNCGGHNDKAIAYLSTHFPGATVILAARWALTAEGVRQAGESGGSALLARNGEAAPGVAGNAALFREGLDAAIGRLVADGHRVILIDGVPEIGFDGAKALARRGMTIPGKPAPDRATYDRRNARAKAILESVAAKHGARIIGIVDVMCTDTCPLTIDGKSMYRDDDHLSIDAARIIIPKIMANE